MRNITKKTKTCPQPSIIEQHLRENAEFEGKIKEGDRVCYTCYRSHLFILQRRNETSLDSDLLETISTLSHQIDEPSTSTIQSISDLIDAAMLRTVTTVGRELLNGNVMLLPDIHDIFNSYASELSKYLHEDNINISKLVTSAHILSNLTANLQHHIAYTCTVKKYGTLIYRPNADLRPALAQALWRIRTNREGESPGVGNSSDHREVLNDLNSRACSHVASYLTKCEEKPFNFLDLSIEKEIENTDPKLWEAICLLTRSTSERKGLAKVIEPSSTAHHSKKIHRFFLLSTLLHCINDRYNNPLHTYITDLIEGQGGSALLIKFMNQLGACSSSDTLSRYIQNKVSRSNEHITQCLNQDSFTVVTVDNIDFLHSYARVYKGSNNSSWHGTTIQAVQPLPSLSIHSQTATTSATAEQVLSDHTQVMDSTTSPSFPMDTCARNDHSTSVRTVGESPCEQCVNTEANGSSHLEQASSNNEIAYRCALNRKKRARVSPFASPKQVTRSPVPKKPRRPRTGTEQPTSPIESNATSSSYEFVNVCKEKTQVDKNLSDFLPNDEEISSLNEFQEEIHTYMMQKLALDSAESSKVFLNLQDYLSLTTANHTERSNVLYLDVMDAKSDSKDTLMSMLQDLHQEFVIKQGHQHLVVEGDAKIYELLQSLKLEYGDEFQWLIPFPGDWHLLMNYQSALMKPYFDAGLKELAEACGYPVAAIQNCSQFKRTHHFIMESWEAMYCSMLDAFIDTASEGNPSAENTVPHLLEKVKTAMNNTDQGKENFRKAFGARVADITASISPIYEQFKDFIRNMAQKDETWRFWVQYVFVDAMAYVSLFLAMRSGDWHLRMSSIKTMAPVFTAFDHPTYQKLISNHISDLLSLPKSVLLMFEQGAFVVNIRGRSWHSVGLDEAHEMLINRQCKSSITKPNPDFINRISKYLTHRAEALEHLKKQIFPIPNEHQKVPSIFSSNVNDKKHQTNVKAQLAALKRSSLFDSHAHQRGLLNPFTGAMAVGQSYNDLLKFREIGREEYLIRISYFILRNPSVQAPNRRRTLRTFSTKTVTKKRVSKLERDQRLVLSAMKKKILFSKKTGIPIDRPGEQLTEHPLSISDCNGNPIKGQKSYFTKSIEGRYKSSPTKVFTPYIPAGWIPECSIIEGMFAINTSPLRSHTTMADYARFLLRRFIVSQFTKGGKEVHVIFDNPGRLQNTPKYFEQKRRDASAKVSADHKCHDITSSTVLPHKKWRETYINCRMCKRKLVKFIGNYFLHNAGAYLNKSQTLYVAGAFDGDITDTAWYVNGQVQDGPQPDPTFTCVAEETDTRLWLHVRKTQYKKILIMSPDTDVYNIGLPLPSIQEKEVIVQISTYSSRELKFLHLSSLITALKNDPDLARIRHEILPQVFQTMYVASGCDYTSFFSEIGKATFLRYLYQYADFITGESNPDTPGTLADTELEGDKYKLGYLAFIRLIGTVYFKKHSSGFQSHCPKSHFSSFIDKNLSIEEQHLKWLDDIRQTIWYRTKFENEMIASDDALMLHWKRSCWILNMWKQADKSKMNLHPMTRYGWKVYEGMLRIEWDSETNIITVRDRVQALTKGCKCTTGCNTNRCSCRKNGNKCSIGCECINCVNTPQSNLGQDTELTHLSEEEHTCTTDEMMANIFGGSPGAQHTGSDTESDTESISDTEDPIYGGMYRGQTAV